MIRGRLAIAVVAVYAAPAFAATDVSAVAGANAPAAPDAVAFSGVLPDSVACGGSDCFTGAPAVTLSGEAAAVGAIETGVISAIAAWIDNPEPIAGGDGASLLAEDASGAGFVVDLESFALGVAMLQGEGDLSLLGDGATETGLGLALLDAGAEAVPEAEWASACGASNDSAVAVTLASIATGCPEPPAHYAGVLNATPDLTSDFTQNLWNYGDPAGLLSGWFFFPRPPPASGSGGSSWAMSLPGFSPAPMRLGAPGGSLLQAPLSPGFALTVPNQAPDTSTPAAAVPEPATWALLIAGFAMIGGAMRRRKAAAPALAAARA